MKQNISLLLLVLTLGFGLWTLDSQATAFYGQFYNANGTAITNAGTLTAYPQQNTWTVYGTNVIFGGGTINLTPNAGGYFTNWCYPNGYRLTFAGITGSLYVQIPDTTNFISLAQCVTNAPTYGGTPLNSYGLVTNWLGFAPAPATLPGITNSLGFPLLLATNTTVSVSGVSWQTNSAGAVTNLTLTLTTNTIIYLQ